MNFPHTSDVTPVRRVLILADDGAAATLEERFVAAGYEILRTATDRAARDAAEFQADVMVATVGEGEEARKEAFELVRRLRSHAGTFALPLVFVFRTDERTMRGAALGLGVDDYFSLMTPPEEIRARLDSLFWRVDAGRRAAPVAGDQRTEIDNFLLLLDAVRVDAEGGAEGSLALIATSARDGAQEPGRASTIAEAYGHLKLNLRRADSVAFYGPTMILAYMPHRSPAEAEEILTGLREEFLTARADAELVFGLASFHADGREVEQLVERAEGRLQGARTGNVRASAVVPPAETEATAAVSHLSLVQTRTPAPLPNETGAATESHVRAVAHAVEQPRVMTGAFSEDIAQARQPGRSAASRGPRRLMLAVSDAARMARLNLLIRAAAYEVRAAFDGQQALALLRIERPDLLIVDHELHDMDGLELLRRLRKQQGGLLTTPSLLLLPAGVAEARAEALEIGARVVVTLPYNPDELLDSIRFAGSGEVR